MLTPRSSSTRLDMELDCTAHRRQWHSIVIEAAVVISVRGDVRGYVRLTEQVQGEYCLWNEFIPFPYRKVV